MKKLLLALAIVLSVVLTACTSKEGEARQQIVDRMDALLDVAVTSYTINDCLYAAENDSCYIFDGSVTLKNGFKYKTEYLFQQNEDNMLIGIKNAEYSGSLLRNMNKKVDTGSEFDDVVNAAFNASGLGLSITIFNDLSDGSLVDITDAL